MRTVKKERMLSELLPEDKRRLHELEIQLVELERGNPHIQVSDLYLGLNEMSSRLEELERLAARESKGHRDDFKRRVTHLRSSYEHVKNSLDAHVRKRQGSSFDASRQELFWGSDIEGGRVTDQEVAENTSLSQSERMVKDYIAIGQNTLEELVSQKDRLKVVQRKVFDIVNYLGLSNSLMRLVERRDYTDSWMVFGGMFIVSLLLFMIWYRM